MGTIEVNMETGQAAGTMKVADRGLILEMCPCVSVVLNASVPAFHMACAGI